MVSNAQGAVGRQPRRSARAGDGGDRGQRVGGGLLRRAPRGRALRVPGGCPPFMGHWLRLHAGRLHRGLVRRSRRAAEGDRPGAGRGRRGLGKVEGMSPDGLGRRAMECRQPPGPRGARLLGGHPARAVQEGPRLMDGSLGERDILTYNRQAWDRQVERGNRWTVPVGPEEVARARRGDWRIVLTPTKPVPTDWFPSLRGLDVLCLAGGGGQQGPILAAAEANVIVLDNSPEQLAQDRLVAEREGLVIETVRGDMADLSVFPVARFGLIVHPVSNVFVPDVRPV